MKDKQVAALYFDTQFNGGGISVMREALAELGVNMANRLSPESMITFINSYDAELVFNTFKEKRIERYLKLINRDPTQRVFHDGWINRTNRFIYKI